MRGYFDESYKTKGVYAIGGYISRDKEWRELSRRWRNRRLKDGIQCFHAADCEGGWGEFQQLPSAQRISLKTDLIEIIDGCEQIGGYSAAIVIGDFEKVRDSSARARQVLGPSPYFLCFQVVLMAIGVRFDEYHAGPGMRTALIFEEQEEFSGRARKLFHEFKSLNPTCAPRLTTLTYASKTESVPLEMADNLAYETMKEIHNKKFDPTRPRRISMEKMIPRIQTIRLLTETELLMLAEYGRTSRDFTGNE
jgi:hypothetical protein